MTHTEPTVSVQAFADEDTRIQVESVALTDGAWLSFKGDVTMTGVSICLQDRETVERVFAVLRDWINQ